MNVPLNIAITGGSGFVGRKLAEVLSDSEHSITLLSRSKPYISSNNIKWKSCDLFSTQSTIHALEDIDVVFYLVHSMLPSSRLFQGEFQDSDMLICDNIGKACLKNRIKHIIYLGGLLPEGHISEHLGSRLEVESILKSLGIPITIFRSGMIVGHGGSSFEILKALVIRLPMMILPKWTESATQAIHIDDVVRVLSISIDNKEFQNQTIDLVNGEKLSYKNLLEQTAQGYGLKRRFFPVKINSSGFSKLWVTFFGNSHYNLVSPLIDSLLCNLPQNEPDLLIAENIVYKTYLSMIQNDMEKYGKEIQSRPKKRLNAKKSVRSIQRLPCLKNHNADWIAQEYMEWLPKKFRSLIQVSVDKESGIVDFFFFGWNRPILKLQYIRKNSDDNRQKFHIIGGFLSATNNTGWLEFRQVQNKKYTLTAIHEFVPSLPWFIYKYSQAILHKKVMNSFSKHLLTKA